MKLLQGAKAGGMRPIDLSGYDERIKLNIAARERAAKIRQMQEQTRLKQEEAAKLLSPMNVAKESAKSAFGFVKEIGKNIVGQTAAVGQDVLNVLQPWKKPKTSVNVFGNEYVTPGGRGDIAGQHIKKGEYKQAAGELLEGTIDVVSTFYIPARGIKVIKGGKIINGALTSGVEVGTYGLGYGAAEKLKEGEPYGEVVKEAVKTGAISALAGFTFGLGTGLIGKVFKKKQVFKENPREIVNIVGKKKPIDDFVASRPDLIIDKVKTLGKDLDGNKIQSRLEWDYKNDRGVLLMTPEANDINLAHEIGHYIEKRYPELIEKNLDEIKVVSGGKQNLNEDFAFSVARVLYDPEARTKAPKLTKDVEDVVKIELPSAQKKPALDSEEVLKTNSDPLIQEAKKYKSAEEFVSKRLGLSKSIEHAYDNLLGNSYILKDHRAQLQISLNENPKEIYLTNIASKDLNDLKKPKVGAGLGTDVVQELKKYADATGKKLIIADATESGSKYWDTIKWLERDYGIKMKDNGNTISIPSAYSYSPKSQLEEIWNKAQKETPGVSFLDKNAERVYKKVEKEKNKLARAEYRQEKELLEESVAFHDEYGELDNQYQAFKKLYNRYKTGKVRQALDSIDVEEVKAALKGKVSATEIDNMFYAQDMYDNEVLDSFMTMLEKEKKIKAMRFKKPDPELGEFRTRGLARGIEAKAVENKLARRFGELPIYKTVKVKDQADQTAKLISDDYERALKVAMGEEKAPDGLLPESVMVGIEEEAIKRGDVETLRKLATSSKLVSEATEMGQRIRMLAERNPHSPVRYLRSMRDAKLEVAGGEERISRYVKKTVQKIDKEITKNIPFKKVQDFINKIEC